MIIFNKIEYKELKSKQKETYNFQKVSAILAEYGFATIKLNDDWQGADFIAQHIDGETYLRVQLKSRLTFHKKYLGKQIFICFPANNKWYFYNHDNLLNNFLVNKKGMSVSESWSKYGSYTFRKLSRKSLELMKEFEIG